MIKIEIREAEGVPICGDGCCHDDGLMIDKILNGKWQDDEFHQSEDCSAFQIFPEFGVLHLLRVR